ncbi:hypothetical protein F5Y17DRAFT_345594 [Xylariaceae sp. FL0594]|nr:hypothetical protein F5Y17DRAFT_345594 [Xylariaceae sp. FL0594]
MSAATPTPPRGRVGGFPSTPVVRGGPKASAHLQPQAPTSNGSARKSALPLAPADAAPAAAAPGSQPLIPLTLIDAPTQRFYACAIYGVLLAWRLYDYLQVQDNGAHFAYFSKWAFIDAVYLFSLPHLRIPWLELSSQFVLSAFLAAVFCDWWLMFNIPLPFQGWLLAMLKVFYDKEVAISEHNVKVSNIIHNSSLIMGKQIINILPEGSALLNPERHPFCLGPDQPLATVPLHFNATVPIEVELTRFDLETNAQETLKLSRKEIKEIGKLSTSSLEDGLVTTYKYDLNLKKPGAYRLNKVLDEYKLEVQRLTHPTYVVNCPKARVRKAESRTRCHGDLSDLSLEVEGTPPLKIYYSRTINGKDHSFHFQSLQPDGFTSPLVSSQSSSSLILSDDPDFTWARSQKVPVGLNESMNHNGEWRYSVNQVHDAFGNQVSYEQDEQDPRPTPQELYQDFIVRKRPRATLVGCDLRNPIKVAKGTFTHLPIRIDPSSDANDKLPYTLTWQFSPIDTLSKSGDHGDAIEYESYSTPFMGLRPEISEPGLYTLKSVSFDSCEGEIEEPSSCLLLNPLEPTLALQAEAIPDKCAGNPIGLRVNLDLVGSPPFIVYYDVIKDGMPRQERVKVNGLRHQLDLVPQNEGYYEYRFRKLQDSVYTVSLPLSHEFHMEQHVKPAATAFFDRGAARSDVYHACLDQPLKFDVGLLGDKPFSLEWEMVHEGRRKAGKASDILDSKFTIETAPFAAGGDYTLSLKSIRDKSGCKVFLEDSVKISVRRQKPRAAFGLLENKRSTTVVESAHVNLPLKLSGDGPWKVTYRNLNSTAGPQIRVARSGNDFIEATEQGTYEITDVMDNLCPGTVDPKGNLFSLQWFPRPEMSLVPTDSVRGTDHEHKYLKKDVCEGDVDGFEVSLRGSPPYHVQYEVRSKPRVGSVSVSRKEFDAVLGKASIQMDTVKAGVYTYTFSALSDNLYNNDKRQSPYLTLEQVVNPKPSASFLKPGQTFKSCVSDEVDQHIPVKLEGQAPFYLELEIKHHAGTYPEIYRIPNIPSNEYDIRIPRQYLKLGPQQIRIRKVRDDRGCQLETSIDGPAVHFQLYDAPTIHPLEQKADYCVGDRIGYTLIGTPPFEIQYTFGGKKMKAKSQTTNFRRVAESPGRFTITGVSDKASECKAAVDLTRDIHPMPAVRISKGRVVQVDIHEGSEVEILFEFEGTPPFEFTYTRSTNAKKGQKSQVIETRHEISHEYSKTVMANLEGTYQVVAIKDKYCSYSTGPPGGSESGRPKLLH